MLTLDIKSILLKLYYLYKIYSVYLSIQFKVEASNLYNAQVINRLITLIGVSVEIHNCILPFQFYLSLGPKIFQWRKQMVFTANIKPFLPFIIQWKGKRLRNYLSDEKQEKASSKISNSRSPYWSKRWNFLRSYWKTGNVPAC